MDVVAKEKAKFLAALERAVRKAEKALAGVAAGDDSHAFLAAREGMWRAYNRALAAFETTADRDAANDAMFARVSSKYAAALESGRAARELARAEERRKLDEADRDRRIAENARR